MTTINSCFSWYLRPSSKPGQRPVVLLFKATLAFTQLVLRGPSSIYLCVQGKTGRLWRRRISRKNNAERQEGYPKDREHLQCCRVVSSEEFKQVGYGHQLYQHPALHQPATAVFSACC